MNLNSKQIVTNPLKDKKWWKWPRATRESSMNLKSISNKDVGLNEVKIQTRDNNLKTCDINKVKKPKQQRKNSSLYCDDIITKKQLFRKINYPYEKLKNEDIEGSKSRQKKYLQIRKPLDPLNPQYKLPQMPPLDIEIPKFIRDNINVDDIVGTKGQSQIKQNQLTQTNYVGDIEGCKPKREKLRNTFIDSLNIADIQTKQKKKYIKDVDPLEPQYKMKYTGIDKVIEIGKIEKNKSKILHRKINKEDLQLKTKDIEGCRVQSAYNKYIVGEQRKQFTQTNKVQDIEGAQVSSRQQGLKTSRQTNPLNPDYYLPQKNQLNFRGELERSVDLNDEDLASQKKCQRSVAQTSREYNILNFATNPYYVESEKIKIKKPETFKTLSEKKLHEIMERRKSKQTKTSKKQKNKENIQSKDQVRQKPQRKQEYKEELNEKRLSQMAVISDKDKKQNKFKISKSKRKSYQKQRPTYAEKFLQLCS